MLKTICLREKINNRKWMIVHYIVFIAPNAKYLFFINYTMGITIARSDSSASNREGNHIERKHYILTKSLKQCLFKSECMTR